jgi:signal transduction histidine kinase
MTFKVFFYQYILNGGIKATDDVSKARAIRMCNLMTLFTILNTIVFGIIIKMIGDVEMFCACLFFGLVFSLELLVVLLGHTVIGRIIIITTGNLVVFYYSCIFRGEIELQYFFYSLAIVVFMNFGWNERKYYSLCVLPLFLSSIGAFMHWNLFEAHEYSYDLHYLRTFAIIAPLIQIIAAFYYYISLLVKFENESNENLKKLNIEHSKQIQLHKLSSLGEMAGGIAHEINNPLMVILGNTYYLKKQFTKVSSENGSAIVRIEKIDSMVHRIVRIVQALKNISRNSDHDPSERIEVKHLIESTMDLCHERFTNKGIKIEVSNEINIALNCRPTEITQVLLNLLNNAFDATESIEDGKVFIRTNRIGDRIQIAIEDNGHGIPPEIMDRIMNPFFSTKDVGQGTGLGLSISKGLIESHQGTIICVSVPSKTIFTINLPAIT